MPHVKLDTFLVHIAENSSTKDHGSHHTPCTIGEEGPLGKVVVLGLGQISTQYVHLTLTWGNSATIDRWIKELVEFNLLEHGQTTRAHLAF
jgi:hypothetical protein